jgi:hypothetical protein
MLPQTASIEAYEGEGAYGPAYAEAVTVACYVEERGDYLRSRHEVTTLPHTLVFTQLEVHCPAGSRITLPSGVVATVSRVARRQFGPPTPDHLELRVDLGEG